MNDEDLIDWEPLELTKEKFNAIKHKIDPDTIDGYGCPAMYYAPLWQLEYFRGRLSKVGSSRMSPFTDFIGDFERVDFFLSQGFQMKHCYNEDGHSMHQLFKTPEIARGYFERGLDPCERSNKTEHYFLFDARQSVIEAYLPYGPFAFTKAELEDLKTESDSREILRYLDEHDCVTLIDA